MCGKGVGDEGGRQKAAKGGKVAYLFLMSHTNMF